MQLNPDGIVGPLTWRTLYQTYLGIEQTVPPSGSDSGIMEYVVKAGDSLWLIARKYQTTVDTLKKLNGLTSDLLNIGQVLKVPVMQNGGSYISHVVQPGDTLWLLSRQYGTTVSAIQKLNGLTGDLLNIGQVLKIPVA